MTSMTLNLPSTWPNRQYSQSVQSSGITWHVQIKGRGPVLLLIHGTGASSHSWGPLSDLLAEQFTLVMPDLPGQGFSQVFPDERMTLPGFATGMQSLLRDLSIEPHLICGHSAGAAVAVQMTLTGTAPTAGVVALNGAFLPFGSIAAPVFSTVAGWLAGSTAVANITALHGFFERPIRNLLRETGSVPTPQMIRCYRTLLKRPSHIRSTLAMMAGWDLEELKQQLPAVRVPLHLLVCEGDKTVSPWQSERLAELVHHARLVHLEDLGHLGHEEMPAPFADYLTRAAQSDAELCA